MTSANDNQGYTEAQKQEMYKAIEFLTSFGLKPFEVMGIYEKMTVHPDVIGRKLWFGSKSDLKRLDGFEMGTSEEKLVISGLLENLAEYNLSPAFVAMMYDCALQGGHLKDV